MLHVKLNENMTPKDWDMVTVTNLSAGGISFYTRNNFEIDTVLDLKIDFSLSPPDIKCVGKVLRTKRHLDTSIIAIAIEFTEIDEQIKKVINNKIIASIRNWDNCQLFNTDACPKINDKFMKQFILNSSIDRRYLPTYDKRKETEINERFAHSCDSFIPF